MPVLSSSSTSTSPEASTARPESASTLRRTSRSMPAIPIADSSAPIVVGMSATSSAISVVTETGVPEYCAYGRRAATTTRKISVSPASRIPSAISFGVLRRAAPSTRAIMRSRKLLPGSWVISTTMRSDSTRVPPVTAERSPPASRITGADSPVIADSSTEAMPSMTVPSPGMTSPASTTTTSPRASCDAGFSPPSWSRATVSVRMARRLAACARPRPSASASARLANTTVSHSQSATVNVNHAGSSPPPSGRPPKSWISQATVVMAAPISTTNMTGLRTCTRGSSLRSESTAAGRRIERSMSERERRCSARGLDGRELGGGHGEVRRSRARLSSRTLTPGSPSTPRKRPSVWSAISRCTRASGRRRTRGDAVRLDRGVGLGDLGIDPGRRAGDGVDGHLRARVRPGL